MDRRYKKTKKHISVCGKVIRIVLILFTLIGVGSWWVWNNHKGWIDKVEKNIVHNYKRGYDKRVDAAEALLKVSKFDEASKVLEGVMTDNVRKQDRLAPYYTRSMEMLLVVSRYQRDARHSLKLSKVLVDFNQNNYVYWLEYANELEKNGKRQEAIDALYRAYRIAPLSLQVVEFLVKLLTIEGKEAESESVIVGYINANRAGAFQVFWASAGEDFSGKRVNSLHSVPITGQLQFIRILINKDNIVKLRVDFPGITFMDLKITTLAIKTATGSEMIDLKEINLKLNDMTRTGTNSFSIIGKYPFMHFELPSSLLQKKLVAVETKLIFEVSELPPSLKKHKTSCDGVLNYR